MQDAAPSRKALLKTRNDGNRPNLRQRAAQLQSAVPIQCVSGIHPHPVQEAELQNYRKRLVREGKLSEEEAPAEKQEPSFEDSEHAYEVWLVLRLPWLG
jgi:hypothetical protein